MTDEILHTYSVKATITFKMHEVYCAKNNADAVTQFKEDIIHKCGSYTEINSLEIKKHE